MSQKHPKTTKNKKAKKDSIPSKESIRIILVGILILIAIFLGIQKINKGANKKEEKSGGEIAEKRMEEFSFQISENAKKEIVLNIKNDSESTKNYDLDITNIKNDLSDTSSLSYEIFLNQEQKVFQEIFPTEEMKLMDGTEVKPHENLEIKFILTYQQNQIDIGKNISAKLSINEAKEMEN